MAESATSSLDRLEAIRLRYGEGAEEEKRALVATLAGASLPDAGRVRRLHEILLFLHVVGATVLLGTGAGIAFFMVASHQSRDPALIAHVAGIVVRADTVFTATAALAQPITGYLLARTAGWPVFEGWVGALAEQRNRELCVLDHRPTSHPGALQENTVAQARTVAHGAAGCQ